MVSLHAALAAVALSATGQTVLLDFYADWCKPCKAMDATVQALAAKGYPVQKINIDQNKQLAAKYQVQSIPCFVMLVDGKEVDRVVGGTTLSRLEQMCKQGNSPGRPPTLLAIGSKPQPGKSPPVKPSALATPFDGWDKQSTVTSRTNAVEQRAAGISDAELIAVSVRLRVEDHNGHSCGSGTIIDTREGQALILTCGHIFRESHGKGKIEVDLFGEGGQRRVPGELIWHTAPDINSPEGNSTPDIGLVAIRVPYPLRAARVAPPGYRITPGMSVASVGCNNGDIPSVQRSKITSLNKFAGAPNIQVAGQPVEGRSGGGLFSPEGYVLGVCNAADPGDREGLFAALESIHAELDRANLAFVYKSPSTMPVANSNSLASDSVVPIPVQAVPGEGNRGSSLNSNNMVQPASWDAPGMAEQPKVAAANVNILPPQEQAALDEIHRRKKEGAEIVIIVRPRDNPEAKTEIFMLDRASPEFRKQLSSEARPQEKMYQETSLETPKPRRVIFEWSADGNTTNRTQTEIGNLPSIR